MTYTFHLYEKENQDNPQTSFTVDTLEEALDKAQSYIENADDISDYLVYAGGWVTLRVTSSTDPSFNVMSLVTLEQYKALYGE
jgi:hypothetical protein